MFIYIVVFYIDPQKYYENCKDISYCKGTFDLARDFAYVV